MLASFPHFDPRDTKNLRVKIADFVTYLSSPLAVEILISHLGQDHNEMPAVPFFLLPVC